MAFPRKLLAPGEDIVLEAHPNWSILVPRVSLFLLVVAASVTVVVEWTHAPLWVGWVLLGIAGVFFLWVLGKIGVWRSTTLVLTNRRVVYRTGVLRRLGREIPLDRVQDVTYSQSIVERLVGAGSLTIQSAGAGGEEPFPDIRHPAAVQSLMNRLISPPAAGYGAGAYPPQGAYEQPQYAPPNPQPQYQPAQNQPPPQYAQPNPQPQYQPAQYQPPQYQPPRYEPAQHPVQPQPPTYPTPSPLPEQPSPQYPQQQVSQQYAPPPVAPPAAQPVPAPADSLPSSSSEELTRLDELLRLGVITNAEYETKRRELLEGR
ncbi:MAG: PH domain-containing protein [Acidimicrobiales bacterium]|jgi:membrane protein YdbS with pleckstrin-like domain